MRYLLILLLVANLSACAGRREVQANRLHGPACESLGHVPGSDSWSTCTTQLMRATRARLGSVQMPIANNPQRTLTCDLKSRQAVCQ